MSVSRANPQSSVPFLDLPRANAPFKAAVLADIADLVDSSAFTNGPPVEAFELAFAKYCGVAHCVGVASGLDALRLGLVAAGIQQGVEVLVPANTFVATFEAVTQAGGVPVPVDASTHDYNMDPSAAEAAVSARTGYVMPVHLYGQMADMDALLHLANRTGLGVIEDACQAPGAIRCGRRAGASGTAAAFSFYPGKNLGAFGDAGALTTSNSDIAQAVRSLREHGQSRKYIHDMPGYTARLDTIQALVLARKLEHLDHENRERGRVAEYYAVNLHGVGDVRLPPVAPLSSPVWHLYPIATDHRDELVSHLAACGVGTGLHYPQPPHLSRAYASLGYREGSFPVAESLASELLSLPMFGGISEPELAHVVDSIRSFFDG